MRITEEQKQQILDYFDKGYIVASSYGWGFEIITKKEDLETAIDKHFQIIVVERLPYENTQEFYNDLKNFGPYFIYKDGREIPKDIFQAVSIHERGVEIVFGGKTEFIFYNTLSDKYTWYSKRPIGKEGKTILRV